MYNLIGMHNIFVIAHISAYNICIIMFDIKIIRKLFIDGCLLFIGFLKFRGGPRKTGASHGPDAGQI